MSYAHKAGVSRSLNRFMETLGGAEAFFLPFGSVYPDDDDFRQAVDHVLAAPHLLGFKFQPLVQGFDVNDPRLDYLYERCLEQDFPITMHIGSGPVATELVGIDHFRKLMRRFELLRVCVPHMGWTEFEDFLAMMDDHPNVFLDTAVINITDERIDTEYTVERERLKRHVDRVCFGSDWPLWSTMITRPRSTAWTDSALHRADREKVLRLNAARFLKLEPGTADTT